MNKRHLRGFLWSVGTVLSLGLIYLFYCPHSNLSRVFTPRSGQRKPKAALTTGHYVVCLDCGKELPYDWKEKMEVVREQVQEISQELETSVAER